MVSDSLMKEYLAAFETEPISIQEICSRLNRPESNVRPVLKVLSEFKLIEKVEVKWDGKGKKPVTVAWRKI